MYDRNGKHGLWITDHEPIRLTQQVKAGGCASKLPAGSLRQVLSALPAQTDPNLLVGFDTSDDAGIYRIGPDHGAGADRRLLHSAGR